jgi:hypothetical protein
MLEIIESISAMKYNQNFGFGNRFFSNVDDVINDTNHKFKSFFSRFLTKKNKPPPLPPSNKPRHNLRHPHTL